MKFLRGLLLGLLIALSVLASGLAPAYAHDDGDDKGRSLVAFLTGGNEVTNDGVPNQGDPDGSAIARLQLNPGRGRVCIDASVQQVDPLTLAHIHKGPAGTNGPVVVDFTALISSDGSEVEGCVDADPALVAEILGGPAGFYVNFHNAAFRGGAVRGQLEPRGSLRSVFRTRLTGAAEVGIPGDPDGRGTALVTIKATTLEACINARVRKVAPLILAHIHNAPAGANGPVVVDFTQFIKGNSIRGCVTVNPNLLQAIRSSPANYYVNVHSEEIPSGALRGQLK